MPIRLVALANCGYCLLVSCFLIPSKTVSNVKVYKENKNTCNKCIVYPSSRRIFVSEIKQNKNQIL